MEFLLEVLKLATFSGVTALEALAIPFVFFTCLGFAVKGRKFLQELNNSVPQSILNIKIIMFNAIFIFPLIIFISYLASWSTSHYHLVLVDVSFWQQVNPYLVALIAIFIGDFTGYWRHRLEHTPMLWPAHAVHHSDEDMTWLTLDRFHPVNRLTTFVIDNSVLLLLGMPPFAIIANNLARHYYGYFIHADLPWTYGKAGMIFVSPAMHRWHHSADSRYFYTNFASVFSIIDIVFGTYRVPGPCTSPLGVTDSMEATWTGQITYMFKRRAYQRLLSGSAGLFRWKKRQPEHKKPSDELRKVEPSGKVR